MSPPPPLVPSSSDVTDSRSGLLDLAVIAVPPAVWFLHLNVSYLLVPPSCRAGHRWWLVGVTVAALAVMVPPARRSRALRRDDDADGLERFAGRTGVWLSALFAGATLLVGLSAAIVGPCR